MTDIATATEEWLGTLSEEDHRQAQRLGFGEQPRKKPTPISFTPEDAEQQFQELKFKPEEPSIDFDPGTKEGRDGMACLAAIARLVRWAGASKVRLGVIAAILGQDDRLPNDIAASLKCSRSAVVGAITDGKKHLSKSHDKP